MDTPNEIHFHEVCPIFFFTKIIIQYVLHIYKWITCDTEWACLKPSKSQSFRKSQLVKQNGGWEGYICRRRLPEIRNWGRRN